jgi:hypothetical protein
MEDLLEKARAAIEVIADDTRIAPSSAIELLKEIRDFIDECIDALEEM